MFFQINFGIYYLIVTVLMTIIWDSPKWKVRRSIWLPSMVDHLFDLAFKSPMAVVRKEDYH